MELFKELPLANFVVSVNEEADHCRLNERKDLLDRWPIDFADYVFVDSVLGDCEFGLCIFIFSQLCNVLLIQIVQDFLNSIPSLHLFRFIVLVRGLTVELLDILRMANVSG